MDLSSELRSVGGGIGAGGGSVGDNNGQRKSRGRELERGQTNLCTCGWICEAVLEMLAVASILA